MQSDSVWLGRFRGPMRLVMLGTSAAALTMAAWLIGGHFLSESGIGMHEMLRPEGRPQVQIMLWLMFAAFLSMAIYLSDTVGSIEIAPTGVLDYISLVCSRLAMVGVATIVLVMFYEVVSRYVFEKPTLWANELSLWLAAFVFLLAGLYAMQQRSHIRIYIIYNVMPRWMQKASDVVSVALIWVFTLCLIWGGYTEAAQKWGRMETFGTAWDPPIPATVKPAILIIITLVAIQALSNLIKDWHKEPEQHSPMDDVDEIEIENIRRTLEEPK